MEGGREEKGDRRSLGGRRREHRDRERSKRWDLNTKQNSNNKTAVGRGRNERSREGSPGWEESRGPQRRGSEQGEGRDDEDKKTSPGLGTWQ